MGTIVLSQTDVRELLPMDTCLSLVEQALKTLGRGDALNPLRRGMLLPDKKSLIGMMPGYLQEPEALGLKIVSVFPGNHGSSYDSHQGIVLLFETEHGTPVCIADASEVTAIRTAAASGVATRLLARADASTLGLYGSGVQARTHLDAMLQVRPIQHVRVYSPTARNREMFAERESDRHGVEVVAVDSGEEAARGCDIICTTTSSREPVLLGQWLEPGMHINAVGSSVKITRELDTAAMARAQLFVDRRESTLNESGDYLMAVRDGVINEDHIRGEIGELLLGQAPGRQTDDDITLFKSLGLAVQDLAAAHYLNRVARERNVGTMVDLGGLR